MVGCGDDNAADSSNEQALLCENCEYGSLTDDRDGQTYRSVKIGEQWWMAENLNFKTESGSACYENNDENCVKYGRLYTLDASLKACPKDWHLPSKEEFIILCENIDGGRNAAGKMLKSKKDWMYDGSGLDIYGFSALPAGVMGKEGFSLIGKRTWFRTQSEDIVSLEWNFDNLDIPFTSPDFGGSVRCIKDY